jgi:hypothetical protein
MPLKNAYIPVGNIIIPTPVQQNFELVFFVTGNIAVNADVAAVNPRAPGRMSIQMVIATLKTAPTVTDAIFDVLVGGVSIFAAADRPTILATAFSGQSGPPLAASRVVDESSVITVDVIQIGGGVAGANLAICIIGQVL